MFGFAHTELMGHSMARLYPSLDEFTHIGKLGLPVMQETGTYSDERIMSRSDGALFWCHVAGRALDRADPFAHAVWMFEDISLRRPVSALRLLIGGTLRVPHPEGVRNIELEPGLAHPRSLRVPGAGFPAHGRRACGDLVIEFEPELPHAPEPSLHGLIDELDRALAERAEHHFPELARWESVWLDER